MNLSPRFLLRLLSLGLAFSLAPLADAQLVWSFTTTDESNTVTGTFTSNGSTSDLTGSGTHTFNALTLLSLNINGTDIDNDLIGASARTSGPYDTFVWDQVNGTTYASIENYLVFEVPGNAELLQIGHGQGDSYFGYRTFNLNFSPAIDYTAAATAFSPVPEPSTYVAIVGALTLAVAVVRRGRSRRSTA